MNSQSSILQGNPHNRQSRRLNGVNVVWKNKFGENILKTSQKELP